MAPRPYWHAECITFPDASLPVPGIRVAARNPDGPGQSPRGCLISKRTASAPSLQTSPDMLAPCTRTTLSGILAETGIPVTLWQPSAQGVSPHPAGAVDGAPDMGRFLRGETGPLGTDCVPAGHPGPWPGYPVPNGKTFPWPERHYWLPGWAFSLSPMAHTLVGEHR